MSKACIRAGWDDVPHLSTADKAAMLASYPMHQRAARTRGVPQLGSGAIYPLDEDEFKIKPFALPRYWPRVYGLDVGWRRTAALWGAIDRETGALYVYSEHYRGEAEPSVHAAAIRARGTWIPGVIDPASRGRGQTDGLRLLDIYRDLGLLLTPADHAVDAGIMAVWDRLSTGLIKVFSNLGHFFDEYRLYRRDEGGKLVKENDHLMDALRYMVMSGLGVAATPPAEVEQRHIRTIADSVGA